MLIINAYEHTLRQNLKVDNTARIRYTCSIMEQIGIERLTGIIAFARTASLGSYTSAARTLGVSPSAVSKSVQRLENSLGLKLFSRTTRSITLTAEGRDLYDKAVRLIANIEEIEQSVLSARSEPAGLLKITAPLPIGTHIIAPALPKFLELYPKISIDLRLGDQFTDLIQEGIDVAIRVGDLEDNRLISKALAPHRVCAYASPEYLKARGTPKHPDDLSNHDCVNFRFQSSGQVLAWPFTIGNRILEITPKSKIITNVSDAVIAAVAAGSGIGISPTYVAEPYVRRGEVVQVLSQFAADRSKINALWPQSRRGNPSVKAFVSYIATVFSKS